MSIFDFTEFERNGNVENDIHFTSNEEHIALLDKLSSQALRSIQIFTPDLESAIYSNQNLKNNLLNMARGNRHAQIQILVIDTSSAVRYGHLLLQLAQQLTSKIDIRMPTEEYQEQQLGFILVDKKGFILKPDTKVASGIYNVDCRHRGTRLSEFFSYAWEHAQPDPQTRRLSI